jgi:hypothetical protein
VLAENTDMEKEKTAVKKVILDAYRDGIVNVGDVEAVKKGFHPEFNLLGITRDGTNVWKLPIANWIKSVEKKKEEGKYPPKEKVSFKFLMVDVVGNAGFAKIEFYKGEKLAYTDFLSLYKFKDGWKLVAKIYHQHQ